MSVLLEALHNLWDFFVIRDRLQMRLASDHDVEMARLRAMLEARHRLYVYEKERKERWEDWDKAQWLSIRREKLRAVRE